jgi:hypothetical protein
MARKCRYEIVGRTKDFAVKKSGRVIMTGKSLRDCELRLCGWLGVEKLPESYTKGYKSTVYA